MVDPQAAQTYGEVMTVGPPPSATPFQQATLEFVFGRVWPRPGLSRRDRRWVTLGCVGATGSPQAVADHVYAALNSGDIALPALLELALQCATYSGWPKGAELEMAIRTQWARLCAERGEPAAAWPPLPTESLDPDDGEERLRLGEEEFRSVTLVSPPPRDSPYYQAGILSFVFGHVWRRPGITRRERRLITLACVAAGGSAIPVRSHVQSALESGDLTLDEMSEIALQCAAYCGTTVGQHLDDAATAAWEQIGAS